MLQRNIPNTIREENYTVVALAAVPARHRGQKNCAPDNHQHTLKVIDFENSNFELRNMNYYCKLGQSDFLPHYHCD